MKVIYERLIGGVMRTVAATTAAGDQGAHVKSLVGVGNPFWAWPSIPSGRVIAADFTDAPICDDDPAVNNVLIGSITVDPADVLTYQ